MKIRPATLQDVPSILPLVNNNAKQGLMLLKSPYSVYTQIQSFFVFEQEGRILGCSRLNVVWKDMAEVASLAVAEDAKGKGYGKALVDACLERATYLGIKQVFALTYQCAFFEKCGFHRIERDSLPHKVFGDCLNCPKVENCDENAYMIDL